MATDNDPRPVLRKELARVFQNQRVIRAFEKIFDLIPPEFIDQQIQIDALNLISELAATQSNAALDAISQLTAAVDRLAVAPRAEHVQADDGVAPRAESGDVKALTVEAEITDTTSNLIASAVDLADGAAAAAGTLLNAPVVGNPSKWAPVNDNGVIRYSPLWGP